MIDSLGIHRISDTIFLSRQPFYPFCGLTVPFKTVQEQVIEEKQE
jgi:hypothetical protein